MFIKSASLLALGASAAVASPLQKRQETSASPAVSGSAASTSSVISDATSSGVSSMVTSAIASVISSASGNSTSAPAPTATTSGDATSPAAYAFGCPDGYSLTYGVGVAPYPGVSFEQASSVLSNWTTAIPPPIQSVSSMGSGVGATRMWSLSAGMTNLTVSEVLTRVNDSSPTFLEQEWNLTQPINVTSSFIVSNYTAVLSLYSNATDMNTTTAQLFINSCVSDQPAGLTLLSELITAYLSGLPTLISGSNSTMNSTSMSSSMSTSTGAAASASSATSAASSSVTDAAGTVSSGVSGVVGTVTSGASGAINTLTSGAGGVVNTLTSGAAGAISTLTSII